MSPTDLFRTLIEAPLLLTWQNLVMILAGLVLIYLAIAKDYEPVLLLPIGFGAILANLPLTGITEGEGIVPTKHEKLMVLRSNGDLSDSFTCETLNKKVNELVTLAKNHELDAIKWKLKEIAPEYMPQFKDDKNEIEHKNIFAIEDKDRKLDIDNFVEYDRALPIIQTKEWR